MTKQQSFKDLERRIRELEKADEAREAMRKRLRPVAVRPAPDDKWRRR